MKAALEDLLATQDADGNIAFYSENDLFFKYPLIASVGLHVYRVDRDAAFLRQVFDVSTRYATYLLSRYDADGDFLLERSTWGNDHPREGELEGVGFNAVYALDMLALSRAAVELGTPVDALYWYQGMRTVSTQLINQTYDPRSRFFLPVSNDLQRKESLYSALSVLPVYFNRQLGDNLAGSVILNYVLKKPEPEVDSPLRYLQWDADVGARGVDHLMRSVLMLGALDWNGHADDAQRFADGMRRYIGSNGGGAYAAPAEEDYADYLACIIAGGGHATLFPRHSELALLESLAGIDGVLDAKRKAQLHEGIAVIRDFLVRDGAPDPGDGATVEAAMRQVYWAISAMRAKWRTRTLFTPPHHERVPGFDLYAAFSDLLDDVVATLADVEMRMSRARSAERGFEITATLMNETATPSGNVSIKFGLSARAQDIGVKSITVTHAQTTEPLVDSPVTLAGGAAVSEYWFHVPLPAQSVATVVPIRLTVEVQFTGGPRLRYHFTRGVYVTAPVTYSVSFPQGTILKGGQVPLELNLSKHVQRRLVINAEWYSPAGLRLKEGSSLRLMMPEDRDAAVVKMNVLVPTPCRPGAFPFLLKLFANGEDRGTLAANMFKHYQWIFLGPLPAGGDALRTTYPPEQNVNLRESYRGPRGPVSWAALPHSAYAQNGEIDLTGLVPDGSMNFLYTVIAAAAAKRTVIAFQTGAPAALFVNGAEVAAFPEPDVNVQRVSIDLREGMNNILVKFHATGSNKLFFQLGEEEDLTSDEFSNNLWELVDGYQELHDRGTANTTESQQVVTLTYRDLGANSVAVIGSFNGWSPVNSGMRRAGNGNWEISLHLSPGRYSYRFLVNNDEQVLDPHSAYDEPDGYGGKNSVLVVRKP
ncbi:MAG: isoamylase early set domain-containing protein [Candidatus Krumholzibacteriia bacterium]